MTAQILLVLEKWCFYDFFSKTLDIKKLTELQFLNLKKRCCQGKIGHCKSGVMTSLLKSFWFSRNSVFIDFFIFLFKKFRYKKLKRTSISQPYSGDAARVHSGFANLEFNNDCSNPIGFRDMAFFYDFFMFFFLKKSDRKTDRT